MAGSRGVVVADKATQEHLPIAVRFDGAAKLSGIPASTLRDFHRRGDLAVCSYGRGAHKKRHVILLADLEACLRRLRKPAQWEKDGTA